MKKGWFVKQTFDNEFVHKLEELYQKYGEEIFSIQGIANKHMDIVTFSKEFFGKTNKKPSDAVLMKWADKISKGENIFN